MIELQEAIEKAIRYAKSVNRSPIIENLRVEEVELSDDEKNWLITLGWDELFQEINYPIPTTKRIYKVFIVDTETGKIKMKIWK